MITENDVAVRSPAEREFFAMAKMGLPPLDGLPAILQGVIFNQAKNHGWFETLCGQIAKYPESFPIVASTFEALTIERPELREHYDRAKEAWEASQ